MIVVVNNHPFSYDVENLAEIFFPYEKIKVLSQLPQDCNDNIVAVTEICGDEIIVDARVFEKNAVKKELESKKLFQIKLKNFEFKREFHIVYHKDKSTNLLFQTFIDFLKSKFLL